jgi:hypothetical protein
MCIIKLVNETTSLAEIHSLVQLFMSRSEYKDFSRDGMTKFSFVRAAATCTSDCERKGQGVQSLYSGTHECTTRPSFRAAIGAHYGQTTWVCGTQLPIRETVKNPNHGRAGYERSLRQLISEAISRQIQMPWNHNALSDEGKLRLI